MSHYGDETGLRREGEGFSLLVRNLPYSVLADELREDFSRYGQVRDVHLPKDFYSGKPRGFAFVEYTDRTDAEDARNQMDRRRYDGRNVPPAR